MTLDGPSYAISSFNYDEHERLISSTGFHGQFNYEYDQVGNKLSQENSGFTTFLIIFLIQIVLVKQRKA